MENESYKPEFVDPQNIGNLNNTPPPPPPPESGFQDTPETNNSGQQNLLGVFDLLKLAWQIFLEKLKDIVILIVLSVAVSEVVSVANTRLGSMLFQSIQNIPLFVVVMMALVLVELIFLGIINIAAIRVIGNRDLGWVESLHQSLGKVIPYAKIFFIAIPVAVTFGIIMMIMVMIGTFIGAIVFGGILATSSGSVIVNVIAWLLGFVIILLFVAPFLVVGAWVLFTSYAVILEDMPASHALTYSYELLKGKMRAVIWRMLVLVLLFYLLFFLALIVLAVILVISKGYTFDFKSISRAVTEAMQVFGSWPWWAILILSSIYSFIVSLAGNIIQIFNYNIYENLKAVKMGLIPEDHYARHRTKLWIMFSLGVLIGGLWIYSMLGSLSMPPRLFDNSFLKDRVDSGRSDPSDNFNVTPTSKPLTWKDPWAEQYLKNRSSLLEAESNTSNIDEGETLRIRNYDIVRQSDLQVIASMLKFYKEKNGAYPVSPEVIKLSGYNRVIKDIESVNPDVKLPQDPKKSYYYGYVSVTGKTFELTARLEDTNSYFCDRDIKNICIFKLKSGGSIQSNSNELILPED